MSRRHSHSLPRLQTFVAGVALVSAGCGAVNTSPQASPGTAEGSAQAATPSTAASGGTAGKKTVTVLVGGWGNGQFDPAKADDESLILQRLFQGWLVEADASRSALLPGIASKWETSPDGKTWTYTIAPNIVAQDGEPITA